jgi:hypothetical protein
MHSIRNCNCHLYADDLQIYISFNKDDTDTAVVKLNQDLSRVAQWSKLNGLVLNPLKSKFLVLGTKQRVAKVLALNPKVSIDNDELICVSEARNLGVLMDSVLHFEGHVLETVRNCFYRLKVLYRVRNYLTVDMRVKLCDSLILSKLNYADTAFGECLLSRSKKLVQRLQNACARFCYPIPRRAHVTPFLNQGKLLKMEARRTMHLATLLFGIIKTKEPSYLFQKLRFANPRPRRIPRLICPRHGSASFRGSFTYSATKCWNNIPPPVKNAPTLNSFKNKIKMYLLDQQINPA